MSVADDVKARLESQIPGVTVFTGGPDDGAAGRFVVVRASTGPTESLDLQASQTKRDVTVWVTCVAEYPKNPDGASQAAWMASWLAEKSQAALIGWRPDAKSWKPVHVTSTPPTRDDDYPDRFTFYTVDQYGISRTV